MKRNLLLMTGISLLMLSFNNIAAQSRTYNIFYVDNSYSKNNANFSQEMFGIVGEKVDSINKIDSRFSAIGFFVANGNKPQFASNYRGAKSIIDGLADGSTDAPNSFEDRSYIIGNLLTTDLSGIRAVTFNMFISEASFLNDFIGGNTPGMFINFLPKQIQFLTSCQEENVRVIIYYPAESKKISQQALRSFVGFPGTHNDFASKIKFEFIPI